jgi:hypothetical protein
MMIQAAFLVARIACAIMLLWALARHPYSYYQLLKVVATATFVFGVYCAISWKKTGWAWIFGMLAVVFNPLISIALGRQIWNVVDVVVAAFLLISLFMFKPTMSR